MNIKFLRFMMRVLGRVLPGVTINWVYKLWFRSPRYREPKREEAWRKSATVLGMTTAYGDVITYRWGHAGDPLVILVHGWSGRGTQLGAFTGPLVNAGYHVIAFDAPGHGMSYGESTNLFRIAETLKQLIDEAGQPAVIISHSFGCMVSAYSVRKYQLTTSKLVMISSPTRLNYLIENFVSFLGINEKVEQGFIKKFKSDFGEDIYEQVAADNNLTAWPGKLMIVHDKDDRAVPWQCSHHLEEVTRQVTTLYTQQLGHRRILRDRQVIESIVEFIQGG